MIAALLLAGTCAAMPFYPRDFSGPVCTAANQAIECECSECFSWDASDGANYYEVQRVDMDGTTHLWLTRHDETDTDPTDGTAVYVPSPTMWCPAKQDAFMPLEGRTYKYSVLACADGPACSSWSPQIVYIAAPYAINSFRPPIANNVP